MKGVMWTTENRPRYNRDKLRYPSDLTNEEWGHVEHLIPPAKRGGRRREVDEREVVNGLLYVLSTGCQWRYIPRDLPPRSTLFDYFQRWEYDGTLLRIHSIRSAASWSIGKRVSNSKFRFRGYFRRFGSVFRWVECRTVETSGQGGRIAAAA